MKHGKVWLLLLFLGVVVFAIFFTPLREILSVDNLDKLKNWIQAQGPWAPVVYILLYILATVLFLPGSVLTILGGLLFGVGFGILLVALASNAGAFLAFLIARKLGRESLEKMLRKKFPRLNQGIEDKGFHLVLWLRLIPLFPFSGLNYALGLTNVRIKHYLLATFLGMFPGIFAYVSLGNAATHVSLSDPHTWAKIEVWGPILFILLLIYLPKILKKKKKEIEKLKRPPLP